MVISNGKTAPNRPAMTHPDIYVVARFLEILWLRNKAMKPTQLQMAVGLNYSVFKRYLVWFEAKELVDVQTNASSSKSKREIKITVRGVEAYKQMMGWIEEFIEE
jgi:predicted transcriptional regulator